jgi:hypothetical protein
MTRVETQESLNVYNELRKFDNLVNWNGNFFIGATNEIKFAITPSNSTRTLYVKIGNWNDETCVRISDHCRSLKREGKDLDLDFNSFDIELIKSIYNGYLSYKN